MDSTKHNKIHEISTETPKRLKIIHQLPSARFDNFETPPQSPIKSSRIPTRKNSTLRKLPTPRLTATTSTTTTEITRVWNTVEGEQNYQKFESEIDGYFNASKNQNNNNNSFNSHKSNSMTQFNHSHGDASRNQNTLFSPIQSPKPNYHLPPLTYTSTSNFTPLTRPKIGSSTPIPNTSRVIHVLKDLPFSPTVIDYVYTSIFGLSLILTSHFISNNYQTVKRVLNMVSNHYFPGMHPVLVMFLLFSVCFLMKIVSRSVNMKRIYEMNINDKFDEMGEIKLMTEKVYLKVKNSL
jgi:hypothetical protein